MHLPSQPEGSASRVGQFMTGEHKGLTAGKEARAPGGGQIDC